MIEGLKVTVNGDELKELALKQAAFHKERIAFYTKQLDAFNAIADQGRQNDSRQSPVDATKQKIKEHTVKADYIHFVSSHLVASEEYLLSESDLIQIGVIRRIYY